MCGPIVSALQLTCSVKGNSLLALFFYQSGRAIVYMLAGGLAAQFSGGPLKMHPALGWLLVAFLLFLSLQKFAGMKGFSLPIPLKLLSRGAHRVNTSWGPARPFFLGMLMALLPCALVFWALALAASTGNFVSGAITMFLLVLITSFPLGSVIFGSRFLAKWKIARAEAFFLLFSTLWCSLMTSASLGWIEHLHGSFQLFGYSMMLMFW